MKEFDIKRGNFLKDSNTTPKISLNITTCLLVIMVYGILTFSLKEKMFLEAILIVLIPIIFTVLTEYIWYYISKKTKSINELIKEEHSYLLGLILGLIVPLNTNYLVLILISILVSLGKLIDKKNIINYLALGSLIIIFIDKTIPINYTDFKVSLLFNNNTDSLGTISPLLNLFSLMFLIIKKAVKSIIPILSIIVILIIGTISAIVNNIDLIYPLMNIVSSGLLFSLVFLASDNLTTPLTKKGQILTGLLIGIIVMILRLSNIASDGIIVTIVIVSILNNVIRQLEIKYNFNK